MMVSIMSGIAGFVLSVVKFWGMLVLGAFWLMPSCGGQAFGSRIVLFEALHKKNGQTGLGLGPFWKELLLGSKVFGLGSLGFLETGRKHRGVWKWHTL